MLVLLDAKYPELTDFTRRQSQVCSVMPFALDIEHDHAPCCQHLESSQLGVPTATASC
jgi:hypothetical protein